VTEGHVDAMSTDELVASFRATVVDHVIAGLTVESAEEHSDSGEPAALDIVVSGSIDDVNRYFLDRGWSDGHPVVPPTRDRIEAFLADSGHDPWKVLGVASSSGRDVTVWSIAVNAVMAGCRPEHLPVLLALAEVLLDPAYGAEHSGNTTGADALIVLNGPTTAALGFHHGAWRDA
jgi:hypothetical protein